MRAKIRSGIAILLCVFVLGIGISPATAAHNKSVQHANFGIDALGKHSVLSQTRNRLRTVDYIVTAGRNTSVMSSRGTSARALVALPSGTQVQADRTYNSWTRVHYRGHVGWVPTSHFGRHLGSTMVIPGDGTRVNYGITATRNVRMVSNRGTRSAFIQTLPNGAQAQADRVSGSWTRASYNGKTGWLATAHVRRTPVIASDGTVVNYQATTTRSTQMKTGRGISATVVRNVSSGQTVRVDRVSGSWSRIQYSNQVGWVPSAHLRRTTPAPVIASDGLAVNQAATTTRSAQLVNNRGTRSVSVGSVPRGVNVVVDRVTGSWSRIRYNGITGWIASSATSLNNPSFAMYGTLRRGQSAYHLVQGRTEAELRTNIRNHVLYMRPDQTWWTFIIPRTNARGVVAEEMIITSSMYATTLRELDAWERFDPNAPLYNQNYNRKLVQLATGRQAWAYVASPSMQNYLNRNGIYVSSGDYLRRY